MQITTTTVYKAPIAEGDEVQQTVTSLLFILRYLAVRNCHQFEVSREFRDGVQYLVVIATEPTDVVEIPFLGPGEMTPVEEADWLDGFAQEFVAEWNASDKPKDWPVEQWRQEGEL